MQVTPERYRLIARAALLALSAIIVTGAAVRLTNSGLGCDDWPQCSSTKLIDVSSKHAAIEQVNRFFTGVVGAAVIVAVLASLRRRPVRGDLTTLSWWLVFGVLANAVLGGISVKVDLHPLAVQGHMLLSMFLIVVATTLVRRADEPDRVPRSVAVSTATRRHVRALFVLGWAAIVTGTLVTGAGPHAGDETAPRLDIAISTVARLHGAMVVLTLVAALALAWRVRASAVERRVIQRSLWWWIAIAAAQAALGCVQYFNGVPALLVGFHVAGATAMMWALTRLLLDTSRPVVEPTLPAQSAFAGQAFPAEY